MSSLALADAVVRVTGSNPPWLTYSLPHLRASLRILSRDELRAASSRVCSLFSVRKHYDKMSCIDAILDHFDSRRNLFLSCSLISLRACLRDQNLTVSPCMSRFDMISTFFESTYGNPVALALRKSSWPVLESFTIQDDSTADDMPWLTADLSPWMTRLPRKLLISRLKSCLPSIHPSTRPMFKSSSKQSCWHALLRHLKQRGRFLLCQDDDYLVGQFLCAYPSRLITDISRTSIVREILDAEYGKD